MADRFHLVSDEDSEKIIATRLAERPRVCPYDDPFHRHPETCLCGGSGLRDPERIEPGYLPLPYDHPARSDDESLPFGHPARSHETWPA
jgi:hypothetical protein